MEKRYNVGIVLELLELFSASVDVSFATQTNRTRCVCPWKCILNIHKNFWSDISGGAPIQPYRSGCCEVSS